MSEPKRYITIEEAVSLGNEGLRKAMEEGRHFDYYGLITGALTEARVATRLAKKTLATNEQLVEQNTALVTEVERLRLELIEAASWQVGFEERLRELLNKDGAP
jgi:transposase